MTIDFAKTTPLAETTLAGVAHLKDADYAAMRSGAKPLFGVGNRRCKVFTKRAVNAPFASYLPHGESVRSSVQALYTDVGRVRKSQTRLQSIVGWAGAIGLLAVIIAVLTVFYPLYTNVKDDISTKYMDLKKDIVDINRALGRVDAQQPKDASRTGVQVEPPLKPAPAQREKPGAQSAGEAPKPPATEPDKPAGVGADQKKR